MDTENPKSLSTKGLIMEELQQSPHDSLQLIIVGGADYQKNIFMIRPSMAFRYPFSAMKLLVIRWKDLHHLIQAKRPWNTLACSGYWYNNSDVHHYHSPWQHLADEYSFLGKLQI